MNDNSNIIITGAYGFIGSCLVSHLNQQGYTNLFLVDDFTSDAELVRQGGKEKNLTNKKYIQRVERENLFSWLQTEQPKIDFVFHLGARTDTTEFDYSIHQKLNVEYSQNIWKYCTQHNIPLVYASSAATYGSGELGYDDNHEIIEKLQPLNPYGVSKNEFDKWAIKQTLEPSFGGQGGTPPFWAGLKFFNVYGPNEYHKARMASVIFHSFNQIKNTGKVKLFKSHKEGFTDGNQLRDFVYVKDVVNVCYWLLQAAERVDNFLKVVNSTGAIFNLGTGTARSFNDLTKATFKGLDLEPNIEYIDMPLDIRDKYQYFTQANMSKLKAAGYTQSFYTLEEGVEDYVRNYLSNQNYY
jgi:ADP-L-glycero-D-manno-heptose 6-epimerase